MNSKQLIDVIENKLARLMRVMSMTLPRGDKIIPEYERGILEGLIIASAVVDALGVDIMNGEEVTT